MPTKNLMEEKLIGIDYGGTNIGIAFGTNGLVIPVKIISDKDDQSAITEISRYILEDKIDKIIMGLPLSEDGKETRQSQVVRRFSKLLKIRVKKPLEFENEFRTTKDSRTEAIYLGIAKKHRQIVDDLSAALILKSYYSKLS
ncbi:hypothetical protein A2V49_04410 [candidate division WWE3 bacterium RBG_19FT_COMBO_34_6]|uniref:Putative pre-16S rRNA nuclease n=1 Tax=candidate division WWE3 bacterium RBG_19FT_COMBO_34_6 TaxID=1802612 RepID=A0A1F4UMM4_UNCKA|nr:MAG: hypothetical protein A2V49_04410 [candidate division WWE3 bacterium RBG_19FT_COMBO_34_6]